MVRFQGELSSWLANRHLLAVPLQGREKWNRVRACVSSLVSLPLRALTPVRRAPPHDLIELYLSKAPFANAIRVIRVRALT